MLKLTILKNQLLILALKLPLVSHVSHRWGHWHLQLFGANGKVVWGKDSAAC
jgi:hypothetical protein